MAQRDRLMSLDAKIVGALSRAGLGDPATYEGSPCTVLIDRATQVMGADPSAIVGQRIVVTLQLAEVPKPAAGRRLRLSSGEEFELRDEIERDESRAVWVVVKRG
jgi:hypothetical protein